MRQPISQVLEPLVEKGVSQGLKRFGLGKFLPTTVVTTILITLCMDYGLKILHGAGKALAYPFRKRAQAKVENPLKQRLDVIEPQVDTNTNDLSEMVSRLDALDNRVNALEKTAIGNDKTNQQTVYPIPKYSRLAQMGLSQN